MKNKINNKRFFLALYIINIIIKIKLSNSVSILFIIY